MSETPKFRQLINPHSHSDHSLDGASTVKQIVKRNKDLGASHVSITEHGNMNSAMELYLSAKDKGLKPILGIEAYLINPYHQEYVEMYKKAYAAGLVKTRAKIPEKVERELDGKAMGQYMHVTIHFKDAWAYKYFCQLTPKMYDRAIKKYSELKPLITIDELKGASGHITICSSCMKGPVQISLLPSRDGIIPASPAKSEQMYNVLRDIAGPENFFVEVFPHRITHDWKRPEYDKETKKLITPGQFVPNTCTCDHPDGDLQKPLNRFVLDLANKYGDKPIISLDSHFATPQQKVIQDAKLGNGDEGWQFHESYYIMESDEAAKRLKDTLGLEDKDIERFIDNSYQWASLFDNFKLETNKDRWIMEDTSQPFMARLRSTIDKYGRMKYDNPEYVERLQKEIKIMAYNGKINLLSYLEKVEDIANFCRENDVLINVRGSAGGCLLLYLIGVSAVDPIEYGLSFERFLTEGRIKANTMPDADIDVSDQEKVFKYLREKYGDRMCRLSTDINLKLKSSILDAERFILGSVRPTTESFVKTLPGTPPGVDDQQFVFGHTDKHGVRHQGVFDENTKLQQYAKDNPDIWNVVSEMLGIQKTKGTHACGVVIADKPVQDYCPVMIVDGERVTGFSPKSAEALGLIKFDILGLNTLRDIQDCLKSINARTGQTLDPWKLPYDKVSFDNFAKGLTVTVFQFDSPTAVPLLIGIKPTKISGLSNTTALGRPGTLDAPYGDGRTLADVFLARSQGEEIVYIHKDLAHIMFETLGIQLYQEQTLQIFRDCGGLSYEEAEVVRRGIGKKEEAVLASATGRLRESCLSRGWSNEQVDLLIEQIMASARYSFNKSHSTSYAVCAYACMYLKTNYKLDWWKATLCNADKKEVVTKFWAHVQDFVTLPDINKSKANYEIVGDKIVAPLSMLSGVGPKAYAQLIEHIPYTSLENFVKIHLLKRTADDRSAINKGVAEKLIAAGILDSLFEADLDILGKLTKFNQVYADAREEYAKPVPEKYIGITALGKYMIKKQLIPVYAQDLRNIMLPNHGGKIVESSRFNRWVVQHGENIDYYGRATPNYVEVYDGNQIEYYKGRDVTGEFKNIDQTTGEETRACVAYVLEEKAFPYKNKTKQATRLFLDVNGYFYEEMLWPKKDDVNAETGFKGLPVLIIYRDTEKRMGIQKIIRLLKKEDLDRYNMV